MSARQVRINANGLRIGEDHHHAKLTDHEVEQMRRMYEAGETTLTQLSKMYEVSKGTVHDILNYRRRAQTCVGTRTINMQG